MNNNFERLEREDVVSVDSNLILVNNRTFMVSEFIAATREMALSHLRSLSKGQDNWFAEGTNCKILKPGAEGWKKGKVRFTLEFCPDEPDVEETLASNEPEISQPESPLDDIRKMINVNS